MDGAMGRRDDGLGGGARRRRRRTSRGKRGGEDEGTETEPAQVVAQARCWREECWRSLLEIGVRIGRGMEIHRISGAQTEKPIPTADANDCARQTDLGKALLARSGALQQLSCSCEAP